LVFEFELELSLLERRAGYVDWKATVVTSWWMTVDC
jgi:hypothetical protein